MRDVILILEDNPLRIKGFETMVRTMGMRSFLWNHAGLMIRDIPALLPYAALISLDYSLEDQSGFLSSPGDGFDVVRYLAIQSPACPVILHSGSLEHREAMREHLLRAGWKARCVPSGDSRDLTVGWRFTALELLGLASGNLEEGTGESVSRHRAPD
jgi:DNA-binding NarL/FixJ family response regulator